MSLTLAFWLALPCAAALGLALQRGSTCMVAAVDEVLAGQPPVKGAALLELALWVAAALLLVRALGAPLTLAAGHALSAGLAAGALLLGIGAALNGACLLGTVARLGSGQWAFLATPVGYFGGSGLASLLTLPAAPPLAPGSAPLLALPGVAAVALISAAAGLAVWRWSRGRAFVDAVPVAVAYVALVLLAGAWSYSDLLADLAQSLASRMHELMSSGGLARLGLALALLAGALLGGARAGPWQPGRPTGRQILRCGAGGLLMGLGGTLVPGGNDQLLLLALPMAWPHALLALLLMTLAIGATRAAGASLRR